MMRPLTLACVFLALAILPAWGLTKADCLTCHSDPTLKTASGKTAFVNDDSLSHSVHSGMECTDCHSQPGANFDDAPHWKEVKPPPAPIATRT